MTEHEEKHVELEKKILLLFQEYNFTARCAVKVLEDTMSVIKELISEWEKNNEEKS